jgi:hypothetical protein
MILSSCGKNIFMLENYYGRPNRKERKFLESYQKVESICIPKIKFHHEGNTGRGTKGGASLTRHDIENSLRLSYSNSFNLPLCDSNQESVIPRDLDFIARSLENNNSCCDLTIFPYLIITSYSYRDSDGGGGSTFAVNLDNDRHSFVYRLVTSIYQNDALVYMDNRSYWGKDVFSERDERLRYQVPQEVIDTLVKLSLEEYFKRMK